MPENSTIHVAPANFTPLPPKPVRRPQSEQHALSSVHDRIVTLTRKQAHVALFKNDGDLAQRLVSERECVVHHYTSPVIPGDLPEDPVVVCPWSVFETTIQPNAASITTLLETLPSRRAFIVIENHGPLTPLAFRNLLRAHYAGARVEVIADPLGGRDQRDHWLLGICDPAQKGFRLSLTLPVRDEAGDIEHTIASFYGAVDEVVIGIDPRTVDNTRELVERYADVVFDLQELQGPPGEEQQVAEGGIHFAHARNQGINRCTGDWVFMTEGHEPLATGLDTLLRIDKLIPQHVRIVFVVRTGQGQQWSYPWLFRNEPDLRFKRGTHNILDFPEGSFIVRLPSITTVHERVHTRTVERQAQRRVQNRKYLMEDWVVHDNEASLYYLGSEWREWDDDRAIRYLETLLARPQKNGAMRYQARLILAKCYSKRGERKRAREVLMGCAADDWSRIEHWIWLGDMAFDDEAYDEAVQFFRYAATCTNEPPFTLWWIDCYAYGYIPAQRLAMSYSAWGRLPEALHWAQRAVATLPDDAPAEAREECERNAKIIEDTITERERDNAS